MDGNPTPQVSWFKANSNETFPKGTTLDFTSVRRSATGFYVATASNGIKKNGLAWVHLDVHCKYVYVNIISKYFIKFKT